MSRSTVILRLDLTYHIRDDLNNLENQKSGLKYTEKKRTLILIQTGKEVHYGKRRIGSLLKEGNYEGKG